jgi:hypothetical protein
VLVLLAAGCGEAAVPAPEAASTAPARPAPPGPAGPAAPVRWDGPVDEAAERGLDYVNVSGGPAKATILEANGAGVAVIDLEHDGDLDLVFAQGLPSLEALVDGPGADLEVFLNDGSGRFARAPGPGLAGWWTGLAVGDLDGDGDADLVAGGFGQLQVLLQGEEGSLGRAPRGDLMPVEGTARLDPGEPRAPGQPPWWVTSLALFDADRDGSLDLYVGQYLELDPVDPPLGSLGEGALAVPCRWRGHPVYCGPVGLVPQPDRLLRGRGDGTFEDRTGQWLRDDFLGYTLGVLPFDADGDGDTDLYVACDSVANQLLVNDGRGAFTDVAFSAGVALSPDGAPEAGMGLASGDVDRDGRLDLAVTNFSGEPTALYLGGPEGFVNVTHRAGLYRETRDLLSWGVHLVDLDADGWLELFTANGHVYPQADEPDTGTRYGQAATLWRLGPDLRARRVPATSVRSLLAPEIGARGSALGDFDGDGAPDLVLARIDAPAALGMNRGGPGAQRLAVRCLGPRRGEAVPGAAVGRTPADGIGTRLTVVPVPGSAGTQPFVAEVQTTCGYQSASTPWLHFGLGSASRYAELVVEWPSGRVERLPGGAADRRLTIREGRGIVREEPLP